MVIKINTLSFNTNNFLALIIEITSLKINDVSLYRIKTTSVWPEVRLKLCHVCMENKDMLISCSKTRRRFNHSFHFGGSSQIQLYRYTSTKFQIKLRKKWQESLPTCPVSPLPSLWCSHDHEENSTFEFPRILNSSVHFV